MEIVPTPNFQKEFKHLFKKYPSLNTDIALLRDSLEENPELGVHIGRDCYKIRVAIRSKNKGKSG
jgi:hypothetical protein